MAEHWSPSNPDEEEQPFINRKKDRDSDSSTYHERGNDNSQYRTNGTANAAPSSALTSTFVQRITRRKILHQSSFVKSGLRRVLSSYELVFLGVGFIIGAGIFTIIGKAAQTAGPSLIVSMVLVGFVSVLIALCYAELSTAYPLAGSAYSYAYVIWGELLAWFIGWNLILEYTVASALVARSWSSYFEQFFVSIGAGYPSWLVRIELSQYVVLDFTAAVLVILLTALVCSGLRASVTTNKIVVSIKVLILLFFIGAGSLRTHRANYTPFFPEKKDADGATHADVEAMFIGASLMFFAFIGFDNVSSLAEDTKNPRRALPIGIFGSLTVVVILYVSVAALLVGMVKYTSIAENEPLAAAFNDLTWAKAVIALAAVCGILTTVLSGIMGQSRIYFGMARDGLLPASFTKLSSEQHTPVRATLLSGIPAVFIALLFSIDILGSLTSIGACFAFITVCASVLQRRLGANFVAPFKPPTSPSASSAFLHSDVPDDAVDVAVEGGRGPSSSLSAAHEPKAIKATPSSPSATAHPASAAAVSFDLTVSPPSPSSEPVEAQEGAAAVEGGAGTGGQPQQAQFAPEDTPMNVDNAFWHFAYNQGGASMNGRASVNARGSVSAPAPAPTAGQQQQLAPDLNAATVAGGGMSMKQAPPQGAAASAALPPRHSSVLYGDSLAVPSAASGSSASSASTTGATPFSYVSTDKTAAGPSASSIRNRSAASSSASSSLAVSTGADRDSTVTESPSVSPREPPPSASSASASASSVPASSASTNGGNSSSSTSAPAAAGSGSASSRPALKTSSSASSLFPPTPRPAGRMDDFKRRIPLWALVLTLVVLSVLNSVAYYMEWSSHLIVALCCCVLVVCIAICLLPSYDDRLGADEFHCPLFPYVPLLGIICVIHVMIGQGGLAFAVYAVWVFLGLIVYFCYGFQRHTTS